MFHFGRLFTIEMNKKMACKFSIGSGVVVGEQPANFITTSYTLTSQIEIHSLCTLMAL